MVDQESGISIRFIRQWEPAQSRDFGDFDRAFILAMGDDRTDRSFGLKLADALEFLAFLKRQVH